MPRVKTVSASHRRQGCQGQLSPWEKMARRTAELCVHCVAVLRSTAQQCMAVRCRSALQPLRVATNGCSTHGSGNPTPGASQPNALPVRNHRSARHHGTAAVKKSMYSARAAAANLYRLDRSVPVPSIALCILPQPRCDQGAQVAHSGCTHPHTANATAAHALCM